MLGSVEVPSSFYVCLSPNFSVIVLCDDSVEMLEE